MNTTINKTLLSYRNALSLRGHLVSGWATEANNDAIFAIATDIAQLGYCLSSELINLLKQFSPKSLKMFHADAIASLRQKLGADVRYAPLFRRFPDEIPNRDAILITCHQHFGWYSQIVYYAIYSHWSSDEYNGDWFGRQFPGVVLEEAIKRPSLVSNKPLTPLYPATEDVLQEVFANLVGAKGSISETDKAFVKEIIEESHYYRDFMPTEIPNKENLAFVIGAVASRYGMNEVGTVFLPYMNTATDILRVASAFSGSDVALVDHKRFKLSNSQRKFILTALDALNYENATEDMLRFHSLWLVLAKYLHVNAYADKYPQATKMVQAIRNNPKGISTFNRKIERALWENHIYLTKKLGNKFLNLIATRPGDFARRLDYILRSVSYTEQKAVVKKFLSVADKVASPLLLNLATHMYHRDEQANVRVFMPKGSTTHAKVIRGENRELLDSSIAHTLSSGISDVLSKRYAEKGSLGNVYIDQRLGDIIIPTSMRDASESLRTVARGSKFSIDNNAKVIRMFLYWENQEPYGRVDVDLSLQMMDESFKSTGVVSYYNLESYGITHSGDFTSAPNGAAEFIDVEIDKIIKRDSKGTRYIAVTVNSFTGQPFNTFTAKAGYMTRDGYSGKTFEPKTVEQKYDVTAGTKFAVPMVIDLLERKVIWLDAGLSDTRIFTNIGNKGADLSVLTQYAVEMYREKANLLDLLLLHTRSRAKTVSFTRDPNVKYDTVFDMSFASKVDEILSDWI